MKELEQLKNKNELSEDDIATLALILCDLTDEQNNLLNDDLDRIYKSEEQYEGMKRA